MAVGTVDRSYKQADIRKQVLVVVTSGWVVMCFDQNLKKLWEVSLGDDFPHAAHLREVAVSVTNYTLKHGDAGLVIVGGRMEMQHHVCYRHHCLLRPPPAPRAETPAPSPKRRAAPPSSPHRVSRDVKAMAPPPACRVDAPAPPPKTDWHHISYRLRNRVVQDTSNLKPATSLDDNG
ncbi:hypothetical protein ZWY2020_008838 [Hordeum vulgare]|nr:hypothetical protein ZWY2020_008838 [Hordeum vulgare]